MAAQERIFGSVMLRRAYGLASRRAYSVILMAALAYNIFYKLFWSCRLGLLHEYPLWILSDLTVLIGLDVLLSLAPLQWPRRWVVRVVTFLAALVCAWSVMNAGWLIRNGHQLLPSHLLPLFRDPVNGFSIVGGNFVALPVATVILLGPAVVLLFFFFSVLFKPKLPAYNHRRFQTRMIACGTVVLIAGLLHLVAATGMFGHIKAPQMAHNPQVRALVSLFKFGASKDSARRIIPTFEKIELPVKPSAAASNYNVVIIVLEGIQYRRTSLADMEKDLTPHLARLAAQGAECKYARCTLTHTTKALFSLLTGRYPSVSQDIAEAVPMEKPYASLATVLSRQRNFRTAFFQSAKGNFESRPGLVHNLGFEKFLVREDLPNEDAFVAYLGCDEFALLNPVIEWIESEARPFLLTYVCSVSHDPYEVPEWFAETAKELPDRYEQTIRYTDSFISAFDVELTKLGLADTTIFCVVGDHGEGFGEHGQFGHEMMTYEEVLRIPLIMRAPSLIEPGTVVTQPVSSIDLTPTILGLLGFTPEAVDFDGIDVLSENLPERKVFFSGWLDQSPAGFIHLARKYVYDPLLDLAFFHDLRLDPYELTRIGLAEQETQAIRNEVSQWRRDSFLRLIQQQSGEKTLFDRWDCRWNGRVSTAKYSEKDVD
jgi:membrane-anchored protein YejM (alkaline phosphatase superfamily)